MLKIYLGAAIPECSYRALLRVATVQNESLTLQLYFGFKSLPPALREPLAAQRSRLVLREALAVPWQARLGCPDCGDPAAAGSPQAEHSLRSFHLRPFGPIFFSLWGCCSTFFQHFLVQMKSKEYNPELEVLVTRYPCPALAAEWYPRRLSLPAPVPALPSLLPERQEQSHGSSDGLEQWQD